MKVSIKWLKDYIDVDLSPARLADMLTMAGLEVESVTEVGAGFSGVVTVKIVSLSPHPQADKLHLCMVDRGDSILQVVCGAPNVAVGMVTALATVGAEIPGGYRIKSIAPSWGTLRGDAVLRNENWGSVTTIRALWSCRRIRL